MEFHAFSAICTKHKTTLDTFTFSQLPRNNAVLSTDGEVTAVVFTCSFLRAAQNAKTNNPSTHTHVKQFEFSIGSPIHSINNTKKLSEQIVPLVQEKETKVVPKETTVKNEKEIDQDLSPAEFNELLDINIEQSEKKMPEG